MMKKVILIIIICTLHFNCTAQKDIFYKFDNAAIDSLQSGINGYVKLLNKSEKSLKLYAVVIENNNEFEIYLQEYSHLPKSGLLQLIKSTNRKLKINKAVTVPIIIPADIVSEKLRSDNITSIPLSGFYVKIIYENYVQRVVQTSVLY